MGHRMRKLKRNHSLDHAHNDGEGCKCGCGGKCNGMKRVQANLAARDIRYQTRDGTKYMIVPVIMAKAGVVMNGSLTDPDELIPWGWNGRPVTNGHPEQAGEFVSANEEPDTGDDWHIGTIYNAHLDDKGNLRAEAWIDLNKADPDLISRIKAGDHIDVSTGYFCDEEEATGVSNGREYSTIARNIVPDHLAFLPNEEGACNWEDGCGIRANKRRLRMKSKRDKVLSKILRACGKGAKSPEAAKVAAALSELIPNARGSDDDARQIVADLISNDDSPFTPDDQDSLNAMTSDTLKHMAESYLAPPKDEEPADNEDEPADDDEDEPVDNEDEPTDEDEPVQNEDEDEEKDPPATNKRVAALVKKQVNQALKGILTPDVRVAINHAKELSANHRKTLVDKITKNSAMKKADLMKLDIPTLQMIANGLQGSPDYSGRAVPSFNSDDEQAKGMLPPNVGELIRNRRKEAH